MICAFRSEDFLRWCLSPERNLTHILFFLFPIVFGINLIHFFDEKGLCSRKVDRFFRCFDPLSRDLTEVKRSQRVKILRRMRTVSKSAMFLAKESVTSAPFKRGETNMQIFAKEKCKTLRQIQRFGKEKCKLLRKFQRTKVTSLPSLSLSLSLSHRVHLTHNIGSASALPVMMSCTEAHVVALSPESRVQ